ncbi:TRAP transporter small permease [Catenovulum sediminis]|uniref:TRAP transporter small permease n=1 Tax=Catenovulum sediminis TaxID=1740262 RepID=UPI0011814021|nr:TRAP transporter small permease [Catenovulum sediminis]
MNKLFNRIDNVEKIICGLFLVAIVLLVFLAALMRSFSLPIIWSVDVAQLLFAWLSMIGANLALRHSNHATVDIVFKRFSPSLQHVLRLLFNVIALVILITLFIFGIELSLLNPDRTLGSTEIPYAWVTTAIPVGALLMTITIVRQSSQLVKQGSGDL